MKGLHTVAITAAACSLAFAPTDGGVACDLSAIKQQVPANQTDNLNKCIFDVGWDLFQVTKYPTKDQAYKIQHASACTNSYNSIQWSSNDQRACNITIGKDTISLGKLLDEVLNGRTGNASEYNTTSKSNSSSDSESDSGSWSGSGSNSTKKNTTTEGGSSLAPKTSIAVVMSLAISFVALALQC